MPDLHRFYTDYELTVLCEDSAAARKANGEYLQGAEIPADWERPALTCYDCDAPDEASLRLECNFWARGPGLCGSPALPGTCVQGKCVTAGASGTGPAAQANWDPYYEEYVCPQCGASDGLRIIEEMKVS